MTAARLVFLDIETYRTREARILERITQDALEARPAKNALKEDKIQWDTEAARSERAAEALAKTALNVLYAEPLVIATAFDCEAAPAATSLMGDAPEPIVMAELAAMLDAATGPDSVWVGHNISGFDLPILLNRWRRHGIAPPRNFPAFCAGRWQGRVYDTMQRVPCGGGGFISLTAACEACGLAGKSILWNGAPMNGSRVAEAFEAGESDLIRRYCLEDVELVRRLYMRLTAEDTWGTWPKDAGAAARIAEIECNDSLTPAQKALAQVSIIKTLGVSRAASALSTP